MHLPSPPTATADNRRRWIALAVVCLAQLMIVLDTTIVNVALPAIQRDLHFTQGNLTWVIDALPGHVRQLPAARRATRRPRSAASACSSPASSSSPPPPRSADWLPTQGILIGARFLQGVGAALSASVILAIIVTEFPPAE